MRMKRQYIDDDKVVVHTIYEPMLVSDASRPLTGKGKSQGLGFSNACIGMLGNVGK